MEHALNLEVVTDEVLEWIKHPVRLFAGAGCEEENQRFNALALKLFRIQYSLNQSYQVLIDSRKIKPESLNDWRQIPAVPTNAFKDFEFSCIVPEQRTRVFHSSGTTEQRPSRHFHNDLSLTIYEQSLLSWFEGHMMGDTSRNASGTKTITMVSLTPPPSLAPHSSLVHMIATCANRHGMPNSEWLGHVDPSLGWTIVVDKAIAHLRAVCSQNQPVMILGTAFLFVNLMDALIQRNERLYMPPGSRVMETGGYKGRSRVMRKEQLHQLIHQRLGISRDNIVCEYGMCELSSQAYDHAIDASDTKAPVNMESHARAFRLPSWARPMIVSPETGRCVGEGETGLLRILDLANAWSVCMIQTEDLATRRGDGFELIGRDELAEPRGCSLMTE